MSKREGHPSRTCLVVQEIGDKEIKANSSKYSLLIESNRLGIREKRTGSEKNGQKVIFRSLQNFEKKIPRKKFESSEKDHTDFQFQLRSVRLDLHLISGKLRVVSNFSESN